MLMEKKTTFWDTLIGKKFYFHLKHGAIYTGVIQKVIDVGDNFIFIEIKDKFGKYVLITATQIAEMKLEED